MSRTEPPAHAGPETISSLFAGAAAEAVERTGERCNQLITVWSETFAEAALGLMEAGSAIGQVCGEMNGAYASAATDAYTRLSTLRRRAAGCRTRDDIAELETEGAGIVNAMASTFGRLHAETCVSVCRAIHPAIDRASTASGRFARSLSQ